MQRNEVNEITVMFLSNKMKRKHTKNENTTINNINISAIINTQIELMSNHLLTDDVTSVEVTTPSTHQAKPLKAVTVSQTYQIRYIYLCMTFC